ncbi:MAG TPA: hypothetical protein VNT79_06975 [Phycisphaerae bacterium]|nr:hypothetical protein [Phycisphaerae bacterium]
MVFAKIRLLKIAFGVIALALATIVAKDQFSVFKIREMQSRIDALTVERAQLLDYAERIKASRRVAQVTVAEQDPDAEGGPVTVLHWQQIGANGLLGPVEVVPLRGTQVYFEAMVAKFEYDFIGKQQPGKSTNLAVFRRAFGDGQSPASGHPLDQTAPVLKNESPDARQAETAIWNRFWDMMENPTLAKELGIRVVQCEAPSVRVSEGELWEVTLEAAGGLNLRKIGERGVLKQTTTQPENN